MTWRLAAVVAALCGYLWLVVLSPAHFGDDVVWTIGPNRGIEQADVPAIGFFVLGLWGAWGLRPSAACRE